MVDADKRQAVLVDVAGRVGLSGVGLNAVRLLAKRNRLGSLPEIARRLALLADQKAGVVRAQVTSAGPLPESFYERLIQELESATSRKVAIDRLQDPSLIAGVVTRIGDNTIDGSVKGRLAEIEPSTQRALVGPLPPHPLGSLERGHPQFRAPPQNDKRLSHRS